MRQQNPAPRLSNPLTVKDLPPPRLAFYFVNKDATTSNPSQIDAMQLEELPLPQGDASSAYLYRGRNENGGDDGAGPGHRSDSPPPIQRRGSMSEVEQQERRASIKAIMADESIPPVERRRSIQYLMDGRRNSMGRRSSTGAYSPPQPSCEADTAGGMGTPAEVQDPSGDRRPSLTSKNGAAPTMAPAVPTHPQYQHQAPAPRSSFRRGNLYSKPAVPSHPNEHSKRAELSRPTCPHYDRNCTIVAPCCGAAFGCRICHDDCPVLPPVIPTHKRSDTGHGGGRRKYQRSSSMPSSFTNMNEPEHHTIDRFAIQEVICRECYTRQSSKTNNCISCGTKFGEYHCSICNLWMNSSDRPYHCADCGFCRVGGAENFLHCHDCGMCIDKLLFNEHNCKVGKYMSNCPVCQEDLFSSRSASHEMPCGHAIHWHCFREMATHDSRCPVCKKTAETHERMAPTWNAMAMGIAMQPVPPEMCKVVTITCNDCEKSDENRAWHFLGVQCRSCNSFNTVVERITMMGPEAHAFLSVADPHPAGAQQQQGGVGAAGVHGAARR